MFGTTAITPTSAGPGQAVSVRAQGNVGYQWFDNGVAISGATSATGVITNATTADDGSYTCVVTDGSGAVESAPATVNIVSSPNPGRLINLSSRAAVGTGMGQLIAGYVVGGLGTTGTEPLLIRAAGPAIAPFGVTGVLTGIRT